MENDQELMFKFQMFEQQIQQLSQQLNAVERGIVEMTSLDLGLAEMVGKTGSEIMAPVGRGIFAKTKLLSEELLVDVGEGTMVKKSIPETQKIIQDQIEKLEAAKAELNGALESVNQELTRTMMEAQAKASKNKKE